MRVRIDGASGPRAFWHITMPLLSPVTFFVLVLSMINGFQVFNSVYVMTGGGPANSTMTLVPYIYQQAFSFQSIGPASAIAYCLFLVVLVLTGINFSLQKLWVFYEEA